MKTKKITAYFCDHCNKLYRRKHAAENHEIRCHNNPENQRPCFGCKHLEYVYTSVYEETPYYEGEKSVKAFWCAKKKHYLIPPIARHKQGNNVYEFEDIENIDMPKNCEEFKVLDLSLPFS